MTLKLSEIIIQYRLLDHLVAKMASTDRITCFLWESNLKYRDSRGTTKSNSIVLKFCVNH